MPKKCEGLRFERVTERTFPELAEHIKGLGRFEKCPIDDDHIEMVRNEAFQSGSCFEGYLARMGEEAVGSVILIRSFSTFKGKPTIVMDHLYVVDRCRGMGIGGQLFRFAAGQAAKAGCGRMEWNAFRWNDNALEFYRRMGAEPLDGVIYFRLTDADLARMKF